MGEDRHDADRLYRRIPPMEPVPAAAPFRGEGFWFQIKFDGIRLLADARDHSLVLYNRKGRDRTAHYPELMALFEKTAADDFLLDGELVAPDRSGRPDFLAVIRRDLASPATSRGLAREIPVQYVPFDVLRWKGRWLLDRPLELRLEYLQNIMSGPLCAPATSWRGQEESLWELVKRFNLEGMVAKRAGSLYLPGRKSPLWRKIKHRRTIRAVVGGLIFRERRLRSLCLGKREADGLRYIGNVGSGVPDAAEGSMTRWAGDLVRSDSPFKDFSDAEGVTWLDPVLEVEVEYAEWTPTGRLRQPSLKRMVSDGEQGGTP